MFSSLQEFQHRVKYLRDKLDAIVIEDRLISTAVDSVGENLCAEIEGLLYFYKLSRHRKKQYDYVLAIIILYGAFERFVEEIIDEYVGILSSVHPEYSLLPDKVKSGHVQWAFESIKHTKEVERHQVERELITRLHSCFDGSPDYDLHSKAFSHHTANVRVEIINEMFSRLDVSSVCKKIVQDVNYKQHLKDTLGFADIEQRKLVELVGFVDDLADRRNEVEHGGLPTSFLSIDDLRGMANELDKFVATLVSVLRKKCLTMCTEYVATKMGHTIDCFGANVVCFTLPSGVELSRGQHLIAVSDNQAVDCGEVLEIQIDNVPHDHVSRSEDVDVGVQVGMRVKKSYAYFLIDMTPTIRVLASPVEWP